MTIFGKKLKTSNNDVISAYEYLSDGDFHLDPGVLFPTGALARADQWEGLDCDQSEGWCVSTPSLPPGGWWRLNLLVAARPRVIRRRALFVRWKLPEIQRNIGWKLRITGAVEVLCFGPFHCLSWAGKNCKQMGFYASCLRILSGILVH